MPANRSRTLEWRRCLQQICDRNGPIEIAVASRYDDKHHRDLVWRVRIFNVTESEILIEQPSTLGQVINLHQGIELIAIISIGQNRWTFNTTNLGSVNFKLNAHKEMPALRLLMPDNVQRCQRRNYYRVETAALNLPAVEIWPLLDPKSVVVAERVNEVQIDSQQRPPEVISTSDGRLTLELDDVMPDVGPKFNATLLNIGGGGIGLLIEPRDVATLDRHKLFWIRLALPLELSTPICATGKLVHTHRESSQHCYAGLAFDFSFNPGHQKFVVDQICRYIAVQQREQLQRMRDQGELPDRKSA